MFTYKKQNDQTEVNLLINVNTPIKPTSGISSNIFPRTPDSSKSSSNRSSDDTISCVFDNRKERDNLIQNSPLQTFSTRRLNIQRNHTLLNTTETPDINSNQSVQEANVTQIEVDEINKEITPAAYPTSSTQENEKSKRLREFKEQYSLQQLNNSNVNKRKRSERHDNVIFTYYIT
ncbi:hypothetical protein C1645_556961 [Glomus cerebriforme]|uniref:Uncharacterized protein n=1 Tax=Glomus cerebriforme TaxID=658196 RepID=A0A397TLZ4_9GLOM|nr:hypothetical protein C1645_556961 [Glomus cerebriforme]